MTPEFSAFVQTLLLWTLPALAAAAVAYVVGQAGIAYARFKAAQPDKAYALEQAVQMGVKAAEQTGLKNQWVGQGQAKYDLAFETAAKMLEVYGVKLDGKLIGAAIEAAVFETINQPPAKA